MTSLPLILLLSAISAILAVLFGFFLATEGGYPEGTLSWHRWMGIAVALISVISLLLILGFFDKDSSGIPLKERLNIHFLDSEINKQKKQLGFCLGMLAICISITGHLGGNLTHGEGYLFDYAPSFIQGFISISESEEANYSFPEDADSTLVFEHIIQPALIQKCASCHQGESKKGGLSIMTLEDLKEGGETGPAIEEGSLSTSELYQRVTLNPESKKFMPPKGAGLSYGEITLLKYWIESGIDQKLSVTDEVIPKEIKELIESTYGLSTRRKAHYEKVKLEAAPEATLNEVRKQGFRIATLSEENNFLEVVAIGKLKSENIEALKEIGEQITWLDLGESDVKDESLSVISDFQNLTKLLLDNNPITDQGASALGGLKNLETVNLYNTSIGDSTLNLLAQIKSLQSVYVWNTKVSKELVSRLEEEYPSLAIDIGDMTVAKEQK
ncbi:hypothetical protein JYB62_11400 [Algoriphagus lutimaris]|nr:hypothetical protein [Algoriphagus lutimaris]